LPFKTIEQIRANCEESDASGTGLRRALTAWDLTLLGVGAIIGAASYPPWAPAWRAAWTPTLA